MFAYVTPTVSVTLSGFGRSWEPLPNPQVNVSAPSSCFLSPRDRNRRSRIRLPVWFIWRREISVDSASFRERTLTMPGRERRVWGRKREAGGGGGGVCLPGAHSFHSLQKLWKCPLHTLGSSAELRRCVGGDKMPACCRIVGSETCDVIQRCRTDKSTTCKLVSYSDSWPWPCYRSLEEKPRRNKSDMKNDKTAVYATKETIYLRYALPVQIKRP